MHAKSDAIFQHFAMHCHTYKLHVWPEHSTLTLWMTKSTCAAFVIFACRGTSLVIMMIRRSMRSAYDYAMGVYLWQ